MESMDTLATVGLSEGAAAAVTAFGKAAGKEVMARRKLCIALVLEIVEHGHEPHAVFSEVKTRLFEGKKGRDPQTCALVRKQFQYVRAISRQWHRLELSERENFTAGKRLPSDLFKHVQELVKRDQSTGAPPPDASVAPIAASSVTVTPKAVADVAKWLVSVDISNLSLDEQDAVSRLLESVEEYGRRLRVKAEPERLAA